MILYDFVKCFKLHYFVSPNGCLLFSGKQLNINRHCYQNYCQFCFGVPKKIHLILINMYTRSKTFKCNIFNGILTNNKVMTFERQLSEYCY